MRFFFLTGLVRIGMPLCAEAQDTVQQTVHLKKLSVGREGNSGNEFLVSRRVASGWQRSPLASDVAPEMERDGRAQRVGCGRWKIILGIQA